MKLETKGDEGRSVGDRGLAILITKGKICEIPMVGLLSLSLSSRGGGGGGTPLVVTKESASNCSGWMVVINKP